MYEIEVAGVIIKVTNKPVKNMRLVVSPGTGVRVTAPWLMSEEKIRGFVASKISWIKKHLAKYAGQKPPVKKQYVNGETHPLFGKKYPLQVIDSSGSGGVYLRNDGVLEFKARKGISRKKKADAMDKWYRKVMKDRTPEYILKWQNITGLKVNSWGIKSMKTRWGTCNTRAARIWLNLELVKWPEEWLDYVVLHEILHLKERGHGKVFKALLGRYLPEWKAVKKQMRDVTLWRED